MLLEHFLDHPRAGLEHSELGIGGWGGVGWGGSGSCLRLWLTSFETLPKAGNHLAAACPQTAHSPDARASKSVPLPSCEAVVAVVCL